MSRADIHAATGAALAAIDSAVLPLIIAAAFVLIVVGLVAALAHRRWTMAGLLTFAVILSALVMINAATAP